MCGAISKASNFGTLACRRSFNYSMREELGVAKQFPFPNKCRGCGLVVEGVRVVAPFYKIYKMKCNFRKSINYGTTLKEIISKRPISWGKEVGRDQYLH